MASKITLEEIMKPRIITCGSCGGELHIIPVRDGNEIKTINLCGRCSFPKNE